MGAGDIISPGNQILALTAKKAIPKSEHPKKDSLAEIAVDPDVLAKELALEIEIDPLEQIDEDAFSKVY